MNAIAEPPAVAAPTRVAFPAPQSEPLDWPQVDWQNESFVERRWYVLHVRNRQEKVLGQSLRALGATYFLPTRERVGYHARQKIVVEEPLFPGYLFLRGGLDSAYAADRTGRIISVLAVFDQHRLHEELRQLHAAIVGGAVLMDATFLKCGARVIVRSGPFAGLRGVVERVEGVHHLSLQVEMLGRAVSLEIDARLLDPLE